MTMLTLLKTNDEEKTMAHGPSSSVGVDDGAKTAKPKAATNVAISNAKCF